jgi:alkylation response protein AidB-like acyl-CoA dehydrogenase
VVADLEAAFCFVKDAYTRVAPAIAWHRTTNEPDGHLIADAARIVVEETVERVLPRAIRSVGCAGMMETHPLHMAMRDLMVYMRQPAPDMIRVRLGAGAANDAYRAAFDAA